MRKNETIEQEKHRKEFEAGLPGRIHRLKQLIKDEIAIKRQSKILQPSDVQPNRGGENSGKMMML